MRRTIEWYNAPFSALGLEEEHAVMREALSRYTGDVSALAAEADCVLDNYPEVYYSSDYPTSGYILPFFLARKINSPGENPCDYELSYSEQKSRVYGLHPYVLHMIDDVGTGFGGKLNGRSKFGDRFLIVGFGRANYYLWPYTEWYLINYLVMWTP